MTRLVHRPGACAALSVVLWLGFGSASFAASRSAQETFASPEAAASAFVTAARAHDMTALRAIFGPEGEKFLSSGDRYADAAQESRFVAAYDEKHTLVPDGPARVDLDVGKDDWPLPIPIVQVEGRWRFDTKAGAQEIVDRRIGRNELSAIRVALAYVVAQKDYFARTKRLTGTGFYAERLVSTRGRQDGLYWPAAAGTEESPFASLIAEATEEGYPGENVSGKPIPYQGYYFRVLKGQGPNAPDGAKSYVRSGRMTGGFALLAWPSGYRTSGIVTFQVNQDGIVFQKDLGPDTARAAARITRFDPDLSWARIQETER